ncbi:hypothetical protein [Vibrio parahaemolyticus]|uniref:hypothetical protein n=1 Tax=Vibrio parahaemolyticus TaxID=670 RepID=UPI0004704A4A|nr:hypothetical protein [Vibrio parahaemolyticus]EHK0749052.1 hypothetical protein [Vibrio parahaemolyticus]MCR9782900.1 hypothetical protein [Vibrio parahaemolyticus]MDF4650953.1 hypothetical protein [Vibrio parahaemolyticus]MDG3031934.1 hypothetical protein [Vibrio parahaemolyticus]MDK9418208.1 hypothetical protein [Vibrio parahaemolyticus]
MTDEFIPHSTATSFRGAADVTASETSLPVADFQSATGGNEGLTIRRDIAVKQQDVKKEEILVDAQTIHRCRKNLQKIKDNQFTWNEILLGLAAAGVGIIASAYIADVKLDTGKGIFSFVITPCITVGTGVAYGILKALTHVSASQIAEEVLCDMPNPDETIEVEVSQ